MDIREEFEKLTEIAEILKDEDTHWCDKRGMYINQRVFQDSTTGYLNGAWYAFQEQQKKIDAIIKWVEENKKSIPLSEWHGYKTEEYVDADDLLELLK